MIRYLAIVVIFTIAISLIPNSALALTNDDRNNSVSMSSLSPSTIDLSKIDCEKVAYSADWGLDKTLEVMRHCTGADKEVR
jgi:hypothetical protein